jgi:hypothetical protein
MTTNKRKAEEELQASQEKSAKTKEPQLQAQDSAAQAPNTIEHPSVTLTDEEHQLEQSQPTRPANVAGSKHSANSNVLGKRTYTDVNGETDGEKETTQNDQQSRKKMRIWGRLDTDAAAQRSSPTPNNQPESTVEAEMGKISSTSHHFSVDQLSAFDESIAKLRADHGFEWNEQIPFAGCEKGYGPKRLPLSAYEPHEIQEIYLKWTERWFQEDQRILEGEMKKWRQEARMMT